MSRRALDLPSFDSLYRHGFVRVAAAVPHVRPAEPEFNTERTLALARRAAEHHAALVIFPELGLSAYAIEDLLHQQALADAVIEALTQIVAASTELFPVLVVGAPVRAEGGLFNAAVVVHRGRILGAVPKSYLPEYREYYEKRQFRAARDLIGGEIELLGTTVPFGEDLVFDCHDVPGFQLFVEICEDFWSPIPPSTFGALAGATVLANLSASNITVGKAEYRRQLCAAQSMKLIAGYVFTAAGSGESTTDLAWDGQAMIFERAELLAEAERFAVEEQLVFADLDLDRMVADRATTSNFGDSIHDYRERLATLRRVSFELSPPREAVPLAREIERFPFVPADPASRAERCEEVYNIQVRGLETRLRATGIDRVVIGISGGLDSTHALIVCARAFDRIGLPRSQILAYTMPGFATGAKTLHNARELMRSLGVSAGEIDIRPSAKQMLQDLGHPAADGAAVYDVTYENVQAGERTSHLFRLANYHSGLVVGTGDLSELALGWSTYGVGDQMSHYNVNASVPKTLIQFILRWAIETRQFSDDASRVLQAVLDTEISPELVPGSGDHGDQLQGSEKVVGPYELQDFFLYYVLRFGYRPSKLAFLARSVWRDRERGSWPDLIPLDRRNEYSLEEIRHWLEVFLDRFFRTSQFKRSALPNAPKVGSGGSLSPRGDWRAPSDSSGAAWLDELRRSVPD
ncbi:MAG: NAD(+) synthase [Solirubrobacterales bacterium]|nr:NAD(+) synthase [Solirubrobacterales bacterium]MBV9716825.1 NAD(+) synthase [Solirubrobacterales bacterium]